jgi:hypothetical protein
MKYKLYNVDVEEILGDNRCGSGRVDAIIDQLIGLRLVAIFEARM